jgi:hypothetical protein
VRSRSKALRALAVAAWLSVAPAHVALAQADAAGPDEIEIQAAVDRVKADPNLSQERKTRTLRWKEDDERPERSGFGRWIANFFVWLGQLSRVLVWVVGGLLAIALGVALYRMIRHIEAREIKKIDVVPTHVRDLDIRPESLPDDIGAAAAALWQRGEHRAALALLYRGLLSRLAHVHRVPIRDSTTEGDCIALAAKHLQADRKDYVTRLIRVWQRATYGGRDAQSDEVQALCAEFSQALELRASAGARP